MNCRVTFFLRFCRCIGFVVVLLFLTANVRATSFSPDRITCPVCERYFVEYTIRSWFQGSEPTRDLSNTSFAAGFALTTCPHCLYTAGIDEFKKLPGAVRKGIRAKLDALPAGLRPLPKAKDEDALNSALQWRLAEVCDSVRPADTLRDTLRALGGYYRSGAERKDAMRRAVAALWESANDEARAKARPDLIYLLGELQRRSGDTKQAATTLGLAAKLLQGRENSGLAVMAADSRKLAERGISESLEKQKKTDDSDAERVQILRGKLPAFLAAIRNGEPAKKWLLVIDKKPSDSETLSAVNVLAKEGDTRAMEFVVRWLAQLDAKDVSDYPLPYCIQALASQPTIAAKWVKELRFRDEKVAGAARYAAGIGEIPPRTLALLAKGAEFGPMDKAIFAAAEQRRDRALLSPLLAAMNLPYGTDSYLKALATNTDVPKIEGRISRIHLPKNLPQWSPELRQRQDLEKALLAIRFRELTKKLSESRAMETAGHR